MIFVVTILNSVKFNISINSFICFLYSGQLRLNYPNVNITLLTATATTRVQQDILEQLHINTNYKLFTQSFNRSNLIYECLLKENTDSTLNQITNLIKTNYEQQSGIIYCFSRAECDRTGNRKRKHSPFGIDVRNSFQL